MAELRLTGLAHSKLGPIALAEGGPAKRGFTLRVGTELCDGVVTRIDTKTGTVTVRVPTEGGLRPFRDLLLRL